MSDVTPDAELIGRAVAGDTVAVQQLLLRHHARLAGMMAAQIPVDLRAAIGAEDVCQEAYIVVVRELPSFTPRGPESFFAWLATIAERKLVDTIRMLRAEKRGGGRVMLTAADRTSESMVSLLQQLAVHSRTPSRSVAADELIDAMSRAMAELKPAYREVLQLRFIDGLTAEQTGRRMGRSEGAVMMLTSRALQHLAALVGDPASLPGVRA
ncbi:MAG: ECF RNA polymerase sigma factor SigD [Phycisphaerae bacterium]|nr:ECF RNA polymerase sigma factor SigD [Phycisphaerae bacterium]